jgi:hypothetical protein
MTTRLNPETAPLIRAILNTIVYADIFDYPLTSAQIHRYLTGMRAAPESVSEQLENLGRQPGVLISVGEYYLLSGRENIVDIRKQREQTAARLWPQALRYGRMIAALPFVRMLAVTGSLAMNNAGDQGDIDFMIVTANDRVWLCRLLVLAVVRLATWQKVNLCPNYIVSERALSIPTRNLYAAHEFTQMVPLAGLDTYQEMRRLNPWFKNFLPNADGFPAQTEACDLQSSHPAGLRRLLEMLLSGLLGNWLERWEARRKIRKLSRENSDNPEALFNTDICKGHSNRHGRSTEMVLNERLTRLSLTTEG